MVKQLSFLTFLSLLLTGCGSGGENGNLNDKDSTENLSKTSMEFLQLTQDETGIDFTNTITETKEFNYYAYEYAYNGGGVALGDINNDGLIDIYFTGNQVSDKLYLNKGDMKFEDITATAIPSGADEGWHTGVVMADVNGDGYQDIYVCRAGPWEDKELLTNFLYINNQDNTFTESAVEYGLAIDRPSTHSAFFDLDKDGDLDVYVMNHPGVYKDESFTSEQLQKSMKYGPKSDLLLENVDGKFIDITEKAGIASNTYGLGLAVADITGNGYLDIYIGSDFQDPDFFYVNQGDGTFKNELNERTNHVSTFSMGNDAVDINNDGDLDIISLDMASEDHIKSKRNMGAMSTSVFMDIVKVGFHYQYMFNTLQLNNGNGTFADIGQMAGVSKTDWSWAPLVADFDNDGLKDIIITNGFRRELRDNDYLKEHNAKVEKGIEFDPLEELALVATTKIENYAYKNKGDLTFDKVTANWGLNKPINSNGAAYADLDNDGDLDVVLNNMEEVSAILENKLEGKNNYIQIKLEGHQKNTAALGAKVWLETDEGLQFQEMQTSRGYLSSVTPVLHFGLGKSKVQEITVQFDDGTIIKKEAPALNQLHSFSRNDAKEGVVGISMTKNQFFRDITDSLFKHTDTEVPFNDFETEVLIPNKMSQLGPFISKGDVNGDGLEDVYVSGSLEESGALYLQTSTGFKKQSGPWNKESTREEMESLIFDADSDGDNDLYVVSGSNEFAGNSIYLGHQLYINEGGGKFIDGSDQLPPIPISGQSVAPGDYDGDGDLDLFIGGRQAPGFYPFAPRSFLYLNDNGTFLDATEKSPDLMQPGLVTDALFDDFDGDQDLDLIIVGEWMAVSFFENNGGAFTNVTEKYNPAKDIGWFYSIEKGDFNGDGKNDYIVGNLGENNKFHPSFDKPLEIYVNDFDGNGTNDIVLAKYQNNVCFPVRGRQCSSEQMPFIKEKFPTFSDFASADLSKIYGEGNLESALHYSATDFASTAFISSGGSYSTAHLPSLAQMSPINKFIVKDFNGDGNMDALGVGNNFGVEVETVRYDGGRGVLLLGDGKGGFTALSPQESGFLERNDCKDMELVNFGGQEIIITVSNSAKAKTFLVK